MLFAYSFCPHTCHKCICDVTFSEFKSVSSFPCFMFFRFKLNPLLCGKQEDLQSKCNTKRNLSVTMVSHHHCGSIVKRKHQVGVHGVELHVP